MDGGGDPEGVEVGAPVGVVERMGNAAIDHPGEYCGYEW